jgi:hypothetical protein
VAGDCYLHSSKDYHIVRLKPVRFNQSLNTWTIHRLLQILQLYIMFCKNKAFNNVFLCF